MDILTDKKSFIKSDYWSEPFSSCHFWLACSFKRGYNQSNTNKTPLDSTVLVWILFLCCLQEIMCCPRQPKFFNFPFLPPTSSSLWLLLKPIYKCVTSRSKLYIHLSLFFILVRTLIVNPIKLLIKITSSWLYASVHQRCCPPDSLTNTVNDKELDQRRQRQ